MKIPLRSFYNLGDFFISIFNGQNSVLMTISLFYFDAAPLRNPRSHVKMSTEMFMQLCNFNKCSIILVIYKH